MDEKFGFRKKEGHRGLLPGLESSCLFRCVETVRLLIDSFAIAIMSSYLGGQDDLVIKMEN